MSRENHADNCSPLSDGVAIGNLHLRGAVKAAPTLPEMNHALLKTMTEEYEDNPRGGRREVRLGCRNVSHHGW